VFDLSRMPNGQQLERGFGQFALIGEFEERHELGARPGKLKVLGFVNRGRMGSYDDAVSLARQSGTTPDIGLVRRYAFTDINRSVSAGISLRGERWNRADDTFGFAAARLHAEF